MAYDEALAQRIRESLQDRDGLSERKMFGGLCLMLHGNMFAGVINDELMLRVGAETFEDLLARPGARPMDFTGRPMKGYLYIEASGFKSDNGLSDWLNHALAYVETLPPKGAAKPMKSKRI
jgi:TfoX/Sxy family transcriptional regulator of competence genes